MEQTHRDVVVDAVQKEVERERGGVVGEVLVDVEEEAVHRVLENLQGGSNQLTHAREKGGQVRARSR